MRKMVVAFDPSPEPLRPMGRAHRGVCKEFISGRFLTSTNYFESTANRWNSFLISESSEFGKFARCNIRI